MKFLYSLGEYTIFMNKVFSRPEKWKMFRQNILDEMVTLGVSSLPIVAIISFFMGAVITIQTASNTGGGIIPLYTVGFAVRESVILEFSPTIISLIIAGKVGSNISSEIGTMKVTEQIDALEIMGVNSIGYLMLPKILSTTIFFPILISISIVLSLIGGWFAGVTSGLYSTETYLLGIRAFWEVDQYSLYYALGKSMVFAFLITSIASYFGYYTKGGALEVGKASTTAVVVSSVAILLANYVITQVILI